MGNIIWQDITSYDPKNLSAARLQMHYAVQLPMRAAKVILEKRPDYSHINLDFLPQLQAFASHPLNDKGLRIGVKLPNLTLFAKDDNGIDELSLHGKNNAQAAEWVKARLQQNGIDITNFDRGGFKLPPHPIKEEGANYDCEDNLSLAALTAWFNNSILLLEKIVAKYQHIKPGPAVTACWPHHFDTATLISFDAGDPEEARSIGVGMSPGDGVFDQPYFYINPWPANDGMDFPKVNAPGFWNLEGFISCVAKGDDIIKFAPDEAAMLNYLEDSIQKIATLIGASV